MRLFKGRVAGRVIAIAVCGALLASATLTNAAVSILQHNSTAAENNATPKYYSIIQNYSAENNTADSENVFGYQYKTDNTHSEWQYLDYYRTGYWYNDYYLYREDFPSITDEQWAQISSNSRYNAQWMLATSSSGYMHLRNYNNCFANMPTVPAVAYLFTADIDGYVNISSGKISLYTKEIAEKGYKALLRITKNGENIYPETGYMELDDNTEASYPDLDFAVNEGDEIRFELTANVKPDKNNDDRVWVIWNPYISIRGEEYLYTDTDDIYSGLTMYMDDYFKNQTSGSMTATDALMLATENSKRSKYGVFTALDSIYSGGVIPSGEASVWKYAVAEKIPVGFNSPETNYGITCNSDENGVTVSWNNADTKGVTALQAVCDGKGYAYMVQKNQNSITLPLSPQKGIKLQINGQSGHSEIVSITQEGMTVTANVGTDDSITYLTAVTKEGSGISSAYNLSGSPLSSYKIYYSANDVKSKTAADNYRRSIIFNAVGGEEMMFGFTAFIDGEYEISAPLEVVCEAETQYSILKQDLSGSLTVIDGVRKYSEDKNGFSCLVNLAAGETVWLNAASMGTAEISIGIPRVTYKPQMTDSNGTAAYKYRAVDYIESKAFNKLNYSSASLTNKEGAVWEFGSFENPIETADSVTNYDTLGYTKLAVGDNASSVTSLFKPYEILRGNTWYNSLSMVVSETGTIGATHASGVPGTLHTILGTDRDARSSIGLPYLSRGFMIAVGVGAGKDEKQHNMGIYMKFTAPSSGNVTLNLSDFAQAKTAARVVILKGDEVVKTYASTIPKGETVDLGYMSKGEKVYICYGVGTDTKPYNYGGFPIATVSGEKSVLTFKNSPVSDAISGNYSATINGTFTLPSVSGEIGKTVAGWTDESGNYRLAGSKYTVEGDNTFESDERCYGDITGDGDINAEDISSMRNNLLYGKEDLLKVNDVTSDSSLDLKDLVRMKKWLAGYAVPFCQE